MYSPVIMQDNHILIARQIKLIDKSIDISMICMQTTLFNEGEHLTAHTNKLVAWTQVRLG